MKHLLTLAALLASTLSLAQFTPYNPDADNDQFVGAQDLLAFLPLFGEDWDLDSLIIYPVSELDLAFWCQNELVEYGSNSGLCGDNSYLTVQVPDDADIVYYDEEALSGTQYLLRLSNALKPLIVFGSNHGMSSISGESYTDETGQLIINPNKTFWWLDGEGSNATFLMPFNGKWYTLSGS